MSDTKADRPTLTLTGYQIGLVLGLERVLDKAGLTIVCPDCAETGDLVLSADNAPEDTIWRIDCNCRKRRINRSDVISVPPPSGDLLPAAQEALKAAKLEIRCGRARCYRLTPEMRHTNEGVLVQCQCGRMQFKHRGPKTLMV
jgi:hypothetical protein